MAARHRRIRRGLVLSGMTVGLGMLAGGSAAHAQSLPLEVDPIEVITAPVEVTTTTIPVELPDVQNVTGLVDLDSPLADPAPAPTPADVDAEGGPGPLTLNATDGDDSNPTGDHDGPAGSTGTAATRDQAGSGSAGDPEAPENERPARDVASLRRLAVQSAGDFSVPFLIAGLALAYLFFQRRMYEDDPVLVAAASEDDELLGFS